MSERQELKSSRLFLAALSTVPSVIVALAALWLYSYATVAELPVKYDGGELIAYDPEIGFVAKPDNHVRWISYAGQQDFDIFTDTRSGRISRPMPAPSTADILIVGCSFTWGPFVQNEKTFAAQLPGNVENLAMASYGTVQSLQMLKRNIDLKPKFVVYAFITDHLRRNVMPCAPSYYPFCLDVSHVEADTLSIQPPRGDGVARIHEHILGPEPARWLPHGIDVAIARSRKAWADSHTPGPQDQGRALTFLLDQMSKTAQSAGARFAVLHIPSGYEPPPESLKQAVMSLHIEMIDATAAFAEHRRRGENLYVSDGHLSEAGHSVIAEVLRPILMLHD